jgi:hypothetical protein
MENLIENDHAARAIQARLALQRGLAKLEAAGVSCQLTQTNDGTYERIALTYTHPGHDPCDLTEGWAIGEQDNEALAFTSMTLEVLKLVGAQEP